MTQPIPTNVSCTLLECGNAVQALQNVMRLQFPAQRAYHIARLARLVEIETKHFSEQQTALIKEFGEQLTPTPEDKKEGRLQPFFRVKDENLEEYKKRIEELNAVQVTIEWKAIPIDWFRESTVAPMDIFNLGPFLFGELESE